MNADIDIIVLAVLGIVQLTINITTMFLTLPAKRSIRFSIGVIFIFTLILFGIMLLTNKIGSGFSVLIGLAYLPLILWLFEGQLFQKMFAFFFQFLLTTLLISLAVTAVGLFTGNENNAATMVGLLASSDSNTDMVFACILVFVMFAAYIFLVFKYGRLIFQKLFIYGLPSEWALYSFGAVFSFSIAIIIRNAQISALQHISVLLFILWSFVILCFAIINAHERSKQRFEAEFARDVISSGSGHYQKMNEMLDTLRIMRHDYKYHLDTISELLSSGDKNETEKYLTDIKKNLAEKELPNFCSNSVLNALLSSYSERCAGMNIKFKAEISMPDTISVPNYEMCIVLGNLLENAVEASATQSGTRKIELAINTQGEHLAVMVKNAFIGGTIQNGGRIVSKKKDGGIGLRSVQAVAARHGGELMTEWDDTAFSAYVLLRL